MTGRMSEYTQEERRERKREEGMDGSHEGERESEKREGEGLLIRQPHCCLCFSEL